MLTSGGLAPCLSSSIAALVKSYSDLNQPIELLLYTSGYKGLLLGQSVTLTSSPELATQLASLHDFGGSPLGNSRVKLTNIKDCVARGLVPAGGNPLAAAADRLRADNVDVLHTIGGDDTNTQAAELSKYLKQNGYDLTVVGMPKTIDNDVYPIKQTFGAQTASEQGALFFKNVVAEGSANPRMLIVHEVMGRDSGYLTSSTAREYRKFLAASTSLTSLAPLNFPAINKSALDIHAVFIPEIPLDLETAGARLKKVMDEHDVVNVFISEGAGVSEIVAAMEKEGKTVPRDAFGHVTLAKIDPGKFWSERLSAMVGAEKTLVQKSGYFARAAASGEFDRDLIERCAVVGAKAAIAKVSGCMGEDEERGGRDPPHRVRAHQGGEALRHQVGVVH